MLKNKANSSKAMKRSNKWIFPRN